MADPTSPPVAFLPDGTPIGDEHLHQAIASGAARFKGGQPVHLVNQAGEHYSVPGESAWKEIKNGAKPLTASEFAHYQSIKNASESPLEAAKTVGSGLTRTLTFGASDPLLESISPGYAKQEAIRQEALPALAEGSELLGYGLPVLGELGIGGRLIKGATAAPRALSALARGTGEAATQGLVEGTGKKIARGAITGAVEGAGFGVQQGVSDQTIHDEPLTWSKLALNSAAGATLGGLLGGLGSVFSKKGSKVEQVASKQPRTEPYDWISQPEVTEAVAPVAGKPSLINKIQTASDEAAGAQALKGIGAQGSDIARITKLEGQAGVSRLASRVLDEAGLATGDSLHEVTRKMQSALDRNNATFQRLEDSLESRGVTLDAAGVLSRAENEILTPLRESGIAANRKLANRVDKDFLADFRKTVYGDLEEVDRQIEARTHELMGAQRENLTLKLQEGGGAWQDSQKAYAALRREVNRTVNSAGNIEKLGTQAREQILGELGPLGKPRMTFGELRSLREQITEFLGHNNLFKPDGELTNVQRELKKLHYSIEHEIDSQLGKISPRLADEYIGTKLATADWSRLLQISGKRAGNEAGNRFLSLTDTIWGGAGAMVGGPLGAVTGLAASLVNKTVKSNQASRIVAKVARKLSGEASTLSTPNLIREASEASASTAQRVDETVSKSRFRLPQLNKAAAYQVPVSIGKGTASLIDFIGHLTSNADQLGLSNDSVLAHLDGTPGLQSEVAMTQAQGLKLALDNIPHADQPPNPSLGEHQAPPAKSQAQEYADMLRILDKPSTVLDKFKDGTLTRKQVQTLGQVLPQAMSELQKHTLSALAKQIDQGKTPSYQMRLRMGLLTGVPVDPSDTPGFVNAVQTIYHQIPMAPAPKGRPAPRGKSKLSERRENTLERLEL